MARFSIEDDDMATETIPVLVASMFLLSRLFFFFFFFFSCITMFKCQSMPNVSYIYASELGYKFKIIVQNKSYIYIDSFSSSSADPRSVLRTLICEAALAISSSI